MQVIDTVQVDQLEENDLVETYDDILEVASVQDNGETILIAGFSYITGDFMEHEFTPYEFVNLLGA